jgi:hypothetical protein
MELNRPVGYSLRDKVETQQAQTNGENVSPVFR